MPFAFLYPDALHLDLSQDENEAMHAKVLPESFSSTTFPFLKELAADLFPIAVEPDHNLALQAFLLSDFDYEALTLRINEQFLNHPYNDLFKQKNTLKILLRINTLARNKMIASNDQSTLKTEAEHRQHLETIYCRTRMMTSILITIPPHLFLQTSDKIERSDFLFGLYYDLKVILFNISYGLYYQHFTEELTILKTMFYFAVNFIRTFLTPLLCQQLSLKDLSHYELGRFFHLFELSNIYQYQAVFKLAKGNDQAAETLLDLDLKYRINMKPLYEQLQEKGSQYWKHNHALECHEKMIAEHDSIRQELAEESECNKTRKFYARLLTSTNIFKTSALRQAAYPQIEKVIIECAASLNLLERITLDEQCYNSIDHMIKLVYLMFVRAYDHNLTYLSTCKKMVTKLDRILSKEKKHIIITKIRERLTHHLLAIEDRDQAICLTLSEQPQQTIDAIIQEHTKQSNYIKQLKAHIRSKKAEHTTEQTALKKEISKLEASSKAHVSELQYSKKEVAQLLRKNDGLQTEITQLKTAHSTQHEQATKNFTLLSEKHTVLQSQYTALETSHQTLQQKTSELQTANEDKLAELKKATQQIQGLIKSNALKQQYNKELQASLQILQEPQQTLTEITQLKTQLEQAEQAFTLLKEKHIVLQSQYIALETSHQDLQRSTDELHKANENKLNDLMKANKQIQGLIKSNTLKQQLNKELQASLQALQLPHQTAHPVWVPDTTSVPITPLPIVPLNPLQDFSLDEFEAEELSIDNITILKRLDRMMGSYSGCLEIYGSYVVYLAMCRLKETKKRCPNDLDVRIEIPVPSDTALKILIEQLQNLNFNFKHELRKGMLFTDYINSQIDKGYLNFCRMPGDNNAHSYMIELTMIFPRYQKNKNPFPLTNHSIKILCNQASFDGGDVILRKQLTLQIKQKIFTVDAISLMDLSANVFGFFPRMFRNKKTWGEHFKMDPESTCRILSEMGLIVNFFRTRFTYLACHKACFLEFVGLIKQNDFILEEAKPIINGFLIAILERINIESFHLRSRQEVFNPYNFATIANNMTLHLQQYFKTYAVFFQNNKNENEILTKFYQTLTTTLLKQTTISEDIRFMKAQMSVQNSILFPKGIPMVRRPAAPSYPLLAPVPYDASSGSTVIAFQAAHIVHTSLQQNVEQGEHSRFHRMEF